MIEINRKNIRIWSMLGMRRTVGAVLKYLAEMDEKFLFVPADIGRYFTIDEFKRNYPDRIVNLGICEQNVVGASAGLVNEGFNVLAAGYGTFITARSLDQVRVNMGLMGIPVKLMGAAGGLCDGNFSATHMGLEDVADMRAIPGITVLCPADGAELVKSLEALVKYDKPTYLRLTGRTNMPVVYKEDYDFEIGKAVVLREGNDVALVSNGTLLKNVLDAADILEEKGISCKVVNMHTVKPLDTDILKEIADMKLVVTIEEHVRWGGLGSAVSEFYAEEINRPYQQIIALDKDKYPDSAEYELLLERCGLSKEGIAKSVESRYNILSNK